VDGWEVGGSLPDRLIPLDELCDLLLERRMDRQTKDAAWSVLVRRSRSGGHHWVVGALGVMLPGLRRAARLAAEGIRGDGGDIEMEVVIGFLEGLRLVDSSMRGLPKQLWHMAYQRGIAARPAARRAPDWAAPGRPVPLVSRSGHVDLVLLRAVNEGVVSGVDAEIVGRFRVEMKGMAAIANDLGLSYLDCHARLKVAEERLVDYLSHGRR
jgi:hypothetical protein